MRSSPSRAPPAPARPRSSRSSAASCPPPPAASSSRAARSTRGDPAALQAVRKRSIGFVFQQFNLIPSLTAVENVEYALNIKGVKGRAARKEAARVLNEVGLAAKLHSMPRDLSGGQKQRVAVARALAGRSPILLVDEPTANLDADSARRSSTSSAPWPAPRTAPSWSSPTTPRCRTVVDRVLTIRDGLLSLDVHEDVHLVSVPAPASAPAPGSPACDELSQVVEGWSQGLDGVPTGFPNPQRRFAPEPFSMT